MSRRLSVAELEISEYHGLGLKHEPDRTSQMQDLLVIDKHRLIELHAVEVAALQQDIKGWEAHASDLGDVIRRHGRRASHAYLVAFGAILIAIYLYGEAVRCRV